jgi:hypothetical protein
VAEPCRCPEPNPECMRFRVPMTGRLWELCSGQGRPGHPVTPEVSEALRERYDDLEGWYAAQEAICDGPRG